MPSPPSPGRPSTTARWSGPAAPAHRDPPILSCSPRGSLSKGPVLSELQTASSVASLLLQVCSQACEIDGSKHGHAVEVQLLSATEVVETDAEACCGCLCGVVGCSEWLLSDLGVVSLHLSHLNIKAGECMPRDAQLSG